MKRSALLSLFLLFVLFGFSQKVKMSNDAKDNYVNKQEQSNQEKSFFVYRILLMESVPDSDYSQLRFVEGMNELPTKASTMSFPELNRLSRVKLTDNAEIEILNFLGELNWEVVAIEVVEDKNTKTRKYYLKKAISQ